MRVPKTDVFLTVDTEHSIGGAFENPSLRPVGNDKRVFGRIGKREYGIPLLMDIADRYGLKITFFVEVFNKYFFGEGETRKVVEYISGRGHDVQLHLHPNYFNFTLERPQELRFSDLIGDYPAERQMEMLTEARETLINYGVDTPIAFRAGCFGANAQTLVALAETGFTIDSSYNQAFLDGPCLMPDWNINDVECRGKIFEFPVTNFIEDTGLRSRRNMPLDINGVSFEEMRHVLLSSQEGKGPQAVTIILHSFSFVRPADVQYSKARPRRHVIRRFEKLCRFLANRSDDFSVRTFGNLLPQDLVSMAKARRDVVPEVPAYLSFLRYGGQLFDRI